MGSGRSRDRRLKTLQRRCGRHLLLAQLRPANIDGAKGARNQIRRIVRMIRERWPKVDILLRGDSGFARENLMRWCEGNAVDYVFGLARNEVLLKKARHARSKAAMAMIETGQPVRAYGDCQSACKIDPLSACNIDPLSGTAEVVPVVNRGDPSGFV